MCYMYILWFTHSIHVWTDTHVICMCENFIGKPTSKVSYNFLTLLSVGKLFFSEVVGFPAIVVSSVTPLLTKRLSTRMASVFT